MTNSMRQKADEFFREKRILEWEEVKHALRGVLTDASRLQYQTGELLYIEYPEIGLAMTFALVFPGEEERGLAWVTEGLLDIWGITRHELIRTAEKNTRRESPALIQKMSDFMNRLAQSPVCEIPDDALQVYILTNSDRYMGAAAMLYPGVLQAFAREEECEILYLIPSSIHEILMIPDDGRVDPEALRELLREVNRTVVPDQDILYNDIFRYVSSENRIMTVGRGGMEIPAEWR